METPPRQIGTSETFLKYYKRNIRRTEIELSLSKNFFAKIEIKSKLKQQKKDLARLEKQILIEKKLEEELGE